MQMNIATRARKTIEIIHLITLTVEQNKILTVIGSFSKYAQA